MGEGNRGAAAVDVPDEGLEVLVGAGGVTHFAGIIQRAGQRLLAGDVLAGLEGEDGVLGVGVVGGGDVHQVDVGLGDGFLPLGGGVVPAPEFLEGVVLVGV